MHTVKVGDKCWYSSTFSGLIGVKYIGVKLSLLSNKTEETFEVVEDKGGFKKGELIRESAFITPKKLFKKTGRFTYISTEDYVYEK